MLLTDSGIRVVESLTATSVIWTQRRKKRCARDYMNPVNTSSSAV
jgi:hypothetical protein